MTLRAKCRECGADGQIGRSIVHRPGCAFYRPAPVSSEAVTPLPVAASSQQASDCREADDLTQPCRYLTSCHESRRQLAVAGGLRGRECWAFGTGERRSAPREDQVESAAIQEAKP